MLSFSLAFQIFITIVMSIIVVLQKSSADGVIVTNNKFSNRVHGSFFSKVCIILIFIFMLNSLILARTFTSKSFNSESVIESLENKSTNTDSKYIPQME